MASHGYDDDDFDIVDANEWNQYDSYAMRRAPQHTQIHMTQQMTTKVAPAYDGRTSFFAFEDAIDDWCDITELNVVQHCATDWKEMLNNTRGYWIENYSGIPMKECTISKDFYDLISSKVPRTCSYTVSCSS